MFYLHDKNVKLNLEKRLTIIIIFDLLNVDSVFQIVMNIIMLNFLKRKRNM